MRLLTVGLIYLPANLPFNNSELTQKKSTNDEIKQQRLRRFDLLLKTLKIFERLSINRQQSQQF